MKNKCIVVQCFNTCWRLPQQIMYEVDGVVSFEGHPPTPTFVVVVDHLAHASQNVELLLARFKAMSM